MSESRKNKILGSQAWQEHPKRERPHCFFIGERCPSRISVGIGRCRASSIGWKIVPKGTEGKQHTARICYSPFARTSHTAEVVASVLNLPFEGPQCKVIEDLRERYFGPSFELRSHDKYPEIWAMDEKDPFTRPEGGESVDDVVARLASAMATMESEYQGCAILVVSHGDPLQILQTILDAASKQTEPSCGDFASRIQAVRVPSILSQHRKFALLTGELRTVL
ncbi:hypothetical protein V6N13_080674 [Hibiscus sabdariffa]